MILQLANIASGAVLALPGCKAYLNEETFLRLESALKPWRENIGLVMLVLGLIGLLDRLNILPFYIPEFGSSFPQALPALLTGALLALPKLERYPALAVHIHKLAPYALPLGLISIASGLGSLLFGCVVPTLCRLPF